MTKIIIQGHGIVGQSTELFLKKFLPEVKISYNDPAKNVSPIPTDWTEADYVIVCVNTDLDESLALPENNTKNVNDAINEALAKGFTGTVVVRSTLGMSAIKDYAEQLGQHLLVWPEYIREATWQEDSVNPKFIVLGGEPAEAFADLLTEYKGPAFITDPMEAMVAKLSTNTFLAMKVIFANQVEQLCKSVGADYDIVKVMLENEGRLGTSHWSVPGSDGIAGFSGKCFPKDVQTFETALVKSGLHVDLIRAITDLNNEMRSNVKE
jgi:nucleotide sugar dehydrogenase